MGWPRNNETCRLYQERKDKSYVLVLVANGQNGSGEYDAVANSLAGPNPSLAGTGVAPRYLTNRCRRVSWSDLPANWQNAFLFYMNQGESWDPKTNRGLWRKGDA